ncbi:MAG: hypothetical protein EX271_07085 [Acidimicrobiales bacterium]|nr:hypothetical protein [Hyphomonadaceae bacterium]RZV41887.1 MAG: hypothetical protein EX271_07085 [Acidimicrobiales bacterium]
MTFRIFILSLFIVTFAVGPASANEVTKLEVWGQDSLTYKNRINVFSTDGENWNTVDTQKLTEFGVKIVARCRWNATKKGNLAVDGFDRVSEMKGYIEKYGSSYLRAEYRYENDSGINPIQICQTALTKELAENPNKSKLQVLADGLKISLPAVLHGRFQLTCNKSFKWGYKDIESVSTKVGVIVNCAPSAIAQENLPKEPIEPQSASYVPVFKDVKFSAEKPVYAQKCPALVKFGGMIKANRSGEMKYKFVSKEGVESPVFSRVFGEGGEQPLHTWTETVDKPKAGARLAGTSQANDGMIHRAMTLKILEPEEARTEMAANYSVNCLKVMSVVPQKPAIGKIKIAE